MPILTSPVTINDGSADHIYTFQNQVQSGSSVIATYKELAAAATLAATIKSKYDNSHKTLNRNVFQVNRNLVIQDGSLRLATINISAVYHKEHLLTDVEKLGVQAKNAMLVAGFWTNYLNQI